MEHIGLIGFENIKKLTKRAENAIVWVEILLEAHHPKGQELSRRYIEQQKNITGSEVRAIVQHLRLDGKPVGSNGKGYFWAYTDKELVSTWKHIVQRQNISQIVANALSKTMQNMRSGIKKEGMF